MNLLERGDLTRATEVFLALSRTDKRNPAVWIMLGIVHEKAGQLESAKSSFSKALALDPRHPETHLHLAKISIKQGNRDRAMKYLKKALAIQPFSQPAAVGLGQLLAEAGRYEEADTWLSPIGDAAEAGDSVLTLLGTIKYHLGQLSAAENLFRRVVTRHPEDFAANNNLGILLLDRGSCIEALECFHRALQRAPHLTDIRLNRLKALTCLRRIEEAELEYENIRQVAPEKADSLFNPNAMRLRFPDEVPIAKTARLLFYEQWARRLEVCDWREYNENLELAKTIAIKEWLQEYPVSGLPGLRPFRSLLLPLDPSFQLSLAQHFSQQITKRIMPTRESSASNIRLNTATRLRIGYVSPDFRKGVVALLYRSLFGLHDRSNFEVFGYSLSPDDGSGEHSEIKSGCDRFCYLDQLNNRESAEIIHQHDVHILIDMAGYVAACRPEIFALRPAPIQINYGGYPGTTGSDWIDYKIVSQESIDRSEAKHYSEHLVWLPESHAVVSALPPTQDRPITRAEYALPPEGFVFCCFQRGDKIEPTIFEVWMRILERVPGSVLWLLGKEESLRENLCMSASKRGIDPNRLIFTAQVDIPTHIARQTLADLFLDTVVYSGITTVAMALWSGVPVITCTGRETLVSRLGSEAARAAGIGEWVVNDLAEYEERAVLLASNSEVLSGLRAQIRQQRLTSPLFDIERSVRYLERAYRMIWQRHQDGEPPREFCVPLLDHT